MGSPRLNYADLVRFVLFVNSIALLYWLALRWVWERGRGKPVRSRFDRCFRSGWSGGILLGMAGLGIACFVYGIAIEPTRLTVTNYSIDSHKIPSGQHVRLVLLGDLHVRENGPRERALPELVRSLKPDVILHTGDFFGRHGGMESVVENLLRSWDVPQYACEGNLDDLGDFSGVMHRAGVTVLNGSQTCTCSVRGARLCISGFFSGAETSIHKSLQSLSPDTFNIVLYHHPEGFPETWNTPADLMLAGHIHGGQIRLPFYGALVTLDRSGKRWESGCFEEHGVSLVVTRGIGCEPGVPEMRFCCPPEVVVIDLIGTAGGE